MSTEKEKTVAELLFENEKELQANPADVALLAQREVLLHKQNVEKWLDEVNTHVDEKAKELGQIFGCIVIPALYVIKELEDVAVAYIKKPDTKQSFKLLRLLGENFENGLEMSAKSQLIRDSDLALRQIEGTASDSRFMDVEGKYLPENADLNLSLLFKMQGLVRPFADQFKKK